jgi:DNA-directed RNA polymerase specialized sigma24 family protein
VVTVSVVKGTGAPQLALVKPLQLSGYDCMEFVDEEGKERPRFQLIDGPLNPEDGVVERERTKLLYTALAGLRPRVRAAIEICQLQECSVRETARNLGISTAAAKGRFFHARVALRKACLQKTNPVTRRFRPAA